jgi:CheY-like chemotaxis protein
MKKIKKNMLETVSVTQSHKKSVFQTKHEVFNQLNNPVFFISKMLIFWYLYHMDRTGKSILIISNTSRLCKSLQILLKSNPGIHKIAEASDTSSGLKWIRENKGDIVLIDAALPNEAAWHVLEQIREKFSFCRCILLTHAALQEKKARNAKADAILSEGFSTEELFHVLKSVSHILEDSDITY